MKSRFIAAAAVAVALSAPAFAGTTLYSAYQGSQHGVTERNGDSPTLDQSLAFSTGIDASGIAVTGTGNIYLSSANHLYNYQSNGTLVQDFAFPDPAINYTAVATKGATVYATYTGSQHGVTERDLGLNQFAFFNTGVDATGIAVGDGSHLYISAGHDLYDYLTDGSLVRDMTFPDPAVLYTGIAFADDLVFASYSGDQQGVTIRDLGLNQIGLFGVNFDISGIAAGHNHDLFLSSGNSLYHYTTAGTLLGSETFPDKNIFYKAVAVAPGVPEPASWAMMLGGFGLMGGVMRGRRKAAVSFA